MGNRTKGTTATFVVSVNGNGNSKLQFVCCKRNWKTDVCFLGRQIINGSQQSLFQQKCPSMLVTLYLQ
jgi:hypothetical protein